MQQKAYHYQSGQVVLLIVLVGVIALTVGLSILSQSITNLRTSTEQVNSEKAIEAAEAGVQIALNTNSNIATPSAFGSGNYTQIKSVNISKLSGATFFPNDGKIVPSDVGTDVWLVDHDPTTGKLVTGSPFTGNVTVYWGQGSPSCAVDPQDVPALEVIVLYNNGTSTASQHFTADQCNSRDGFGGVGAGSSITSSGQTISFNYSTNFSVNQAYLIRLIPLYQSTQMGLSSTVNLPLQGNVITSIGQSGDTERKLVYYKSYPVLPPEIFPYLFIVNADQ